MFTARLASLNPTLPGGRADASTARDEPGSGLSRNGAPRLPDEVAPLRHRTAGGPAAPRQSLSGLRQAALPGVASDTDAPHEARTGLAATPQLAAHSDLPTQPQVDTALRALEGLPADWRQELVAWSHVPTATQCLDPPAGGTGNSPPANGFSAARLEAARRVALLAAMGAGGTCLDLEGLGLGSLPPGLQRLTHLTELRIAFNRLDCLPDELGQCAKLERIDAEKNQLRNLPDSLGQLGGLKWLMLESNRLEGLPASLGRCAKLELLNASRNHLVQVPDELGQLAQMKVLMLDDNRLQTLPASLAGCINLRTINAGANRLTVLPDEIADLPSLRRLVVDGSRELVTLPARLDLSRVGVFCKGTPLVLLDRVLAPPRFEAAQAAHLEATLASLTQRWSAGLEKLRSLGGDEAVMQVRHRIEALQKTSVCGLEKVMDGRSRSDEGRGELASGMDLVDGWVRTGAWPTSQRIRSLNTRVCNPEQAGLRDRAHPWRRTASRCGNGSYVDPSALTREMDLFDRWLHQAREAVRPDDRLGQVSLAAQAYQRLLSVHPYEDGNGRTCRQVANWILQGFGLPQVHPSGTTMTPWHAAVFPSRPDLRPSPAALVEAFVASMETAARCAEHVLGELQSAREELGAVGPCSLWVPPAGEEGAVPADTGFRLTAGR